MTKPSKREIRSVFLTLTGIALATIGLKGFLLPSGFLDGGITGISLLVNRLTGIDVSQILFSVVTRLEVQKLLGEVERIDPSAFVVQQTINETRGGMIKKRPLNL